MTCIEKYMMDNPDTEGIYELIRDMCPSDFSYHRDPSYCSSGDDTRCIRCWNRELPNQNSVSEATEDEEKHISKILDSGNRREFETGAVRDIQEGKGRCDLMPLDVVARFIEYPLNISVVIESISEFQNSGDTEYLYKALDFFSYEIGANRQNVCLEVSKHFEEGAKKYGEHNWQKGIPTNCYIDSAVRHYLKFLRGDTDEPHDRAFVWNLLCCIWTCKHKPELNVYRKESDHVAER